MEYFEQGNWRIQNAKIYNILETMTEEEREEFDCDVKKIEWS